MHSPGGFRAFALGASHEVEAMVPHHDGMSSSRGVHLPGPDRPAETRNELRNSGPPAPAVHQCESSLKSSSPATELQTKISDQMSFK